MKKESPAKIIGIYHKDCIDGTTAAAVLLKQFPDIQFFPLTRSYTKEEFENVLHALDKNTILYISDFSLRPDEMVQFINSAQKVINIDHHIGAQEELAMLAKQHNNFEFVFDNDHSGASLTWIYFFGEETMPELIRLVEYGDIHKGEFSDEGIKYSGLYLIPLMNKPKEVLQLFDKPIETILEQGKVSSNLVDYLLDIYLQKTDPIILKIGEHKVVCYNATFTIERLRSTIGNVLAKKHNATVGIYRITGSNVHFSFRGLEEVEPSALLLGNLLGGGGHRNAAGASMPLKDFCKAIIFE